MVEMILPGTYIEVRPEGLIIPRGVTVGNLGVVGTASKGPLNTPVILGSYSAAQEYFGNYDPWINGESNELTLMRALELAYAHGATTVVAVRIAEATTAKKASHVLQSASGDNVTLTAKTEGTWGNDLSVNVWAAEEDAFVEEETPGESPPFSLLKTPIEKNDGNRILVNGSPRTIIYDDATEPLTSGQVQINRTTGALTFPTEEIPDSTKAIIASYTYQESKLVEDETPSGESPFLLTHTPIVKNARNRILVEGRLRTIIYDDATEPLTSGQVQINRTTGALTFPTEEIPDSTKAIIASYTVAEDRAVKVTVRYGQATEVYTVVSGQDLVRDINNSLQGSAWVEAMAGDNARELPTKSSADKIFAPFLGGDNGATGANYQDGLDRLLDQDAHIIVAAGQDESFGNELDAHCQTASTDTIKRDRIAVVGSSLAADAVGATLNTVTNHTLASDRVIFVAPGIKVTDNAVSPPEEVTLPGAYAAAAVAGLLAGYSPHISLTNKTLRIGGLSKHYDSAQLTQLLKSRVLALESRQGFRIVRGITTATNTAWTQITTRRIVDYAKFGVRSAANQFIGRLNNERVRIALRAAIDTFMAGMIEDEMLISYELDVTATREDQRQGIARVTLVLRPVFSIDFIKVTMFLE